MTQDEFFSKIKSYGAILASGVAMGQITLTNSTLQNLRAAMLPMTMINLYTVAGGMNLGAGYIFGPNEFARGAIYPIPSIVQINSELSHNPSMRGKTVFGRNDLFWFAFDSFGTFYMLDNVTLRPLRKYDNAYRALYDCLVAGKI